MTNSPNTFVKPKVGVDELYALWQAERRDPTDPRFLDAVREMAPDDRKGIRRVFERVAVDEETGDWIDILDPVGYPKVWFRGRSEYVTKVMWSLFNGRNVPKHESVLRIKGHLHSVHPDHLELVSRGMAVSLGKRRSSDKTADAKRILMKFSDHSEAEIDEALGIS